MKESSCVLLGKNWEILDADKNNKNNRYFINLCNDLLIEGDAARCHPDASVCMIGELYFYVTVA